MRNLISKLGKVPLCNNQSERAPHLCGKCFILCWRCSMVALCSVSMTALLNITKTDVLFLDIGFTLPVLLLVPMIVDGCLQYFFKRESTNARRALTGALFGIGLGLLIFQLSI